MPEWTSVHTLLQVDGRTSSHICHNTVHIPLTIAKPKIESRLLPTCTTKHNGISTPPRHSRSRGIEESERNPNPNPSSSLKEQRHPRISHIAAPTLDKTAPISLPCADLPPTCRKAPQAVSQRMRVGRLVGSRNRISGCPSMQRRIHTRRRLICLPPKATGQQAAAKILPHFLTCIMHILGPLRSSSSMKCSAHADVMVIQRP